MTGEHYDYTHQAWVGADGRYLCCAHPSTMNCQCYGRLHYGELAPAEHDRLEPDFEVQNEGTLFLLRPISSDAADWIMDHIADDAMRYGDAVVVEHRYICDIIDGIREEGLVVGEA